MHCATRYPHATIHRVLPPDPLFDRCKLSHGGLTRDNVTRIDVTKQDPSHVVVSHHGELLVCTFHPLCIKIIRRTDIGNTVKLFSLLLSRGHGRRFTEHLSPTRGILQS